MHKNRNKFSLLHDITSITYEHTQLVSQVIKEDNATDEG